MVLDGRVVAAAALLRSIALGILTSVLVAVRCGGVRRLTELHRLAMALILQWSKKWRLGGLASLCELELRIVVRILPSIYWLQVLALKELVAVPAIDGVPWVRIALLMLVLLSAVLRELSVS